MKSQIQVCQGISCKSRGSDDIYSAAMKEVGQDLSPEDILDESLDEMTDKDVKVEITRCNCMGNCENGPNVAEETDGKTTIHDFMNTKKIVDLLKKLLHETK